MEQEKNTSFTEQKPEVLNSPLSRQFNDNPQDPGQIWAIIGLITTAIGPALVGLILSIIGYRKSKNAGYTNKIALIGIVLSLCIIVLALLLIAWFSVAWSQEFHF